MATLKDIIVIYHAECPDGFSAAWAAWKKFGDKADYIGVHHGAPPPTGLKNKEIYFLDFTYPEEIMKEMISANKRVTAIDHHFSRERAIKMTQDYSYSVDNSGAVLAWKYFHPRKPVPKMLEYVEDIDLWKFKHKNANEIAAFINDFRYDFKVWDKLVRGIQNDVFRKKAIARGKVIVEHEWRLMNRLIEEGAKIVSFEGYKVYAVNAPHFFASHIGNALIKKKPPMAIIWSEDKERVNVSLRSDGTADVSKIAAKFGGGGHKVSAGFNLPAIDSFPWKEKNF